MKVSVLRLLIDDADQGLVLTDKKHGIATIWLLATLGSKSSLKKVNRRAVLDVNVPTACGTIVDQDAPLALRLQGSLLYGVSRVFSQQCGYLLTDIQGLKEKMQGLRKIMKGIAVDPAVVVARSDQLNLVIDPTFNVDLDMGLDLSFFDIVSSQGSRSITPAALASTNTSLSNDLDLEVPRVYTEDYSFSSADEVVDDLQDLLAVDSRQDTPRAEVADPTAVGPVVLEDDFYIQDDGDIMLRDTSEIPPQQAQESSNDFSLDETGLGPLGEDFELLNALHSNTDNLHDTPNRMREERPGSDSFQHDGQDIMQTEDQSQGRGRQEDEQSVQAPQQRSRRSKFRPLPDNPTELANRVLSDWHDGYLANMAEEDDRKQMVTTLGQARLNAAFWVLQQGIGGVATTLGHDLAHHPLSVFSGENLLEMLRGTDSVAGRKRSISDVASTHESEGRRSKSRSQEILVGGQDNAAQDETGLTLGDDDFELEYGRAAGFELDNRPSEQILPWNTGSRHDSVRPINSFTARSSSAANAGFGGLDTGPPSSLSRHLGRTVSASPLAGRARFPSLPSSPRGQDTTLADDQNLSLMVDNDLDQQLAGDIDEEFELYGPAANVNTQQADDSQWMASTLEEEAHNFLAFVDEALQTRVKDHIEFEKLIEPAKHSEIVAAQGLLHVLALASKGLLQVKQDEHFGVITLRTLTRVEDSHAPRAHI